MKWTRPGPGVLPTWVAEMDVAPCPAVSEALAEAVSRGVFGYTGPDVMSDLAEATAGFLGRRFGWQVDPARVIATGDVMSGIILALEVLCEPAGVVVPVPSYPPFLAAVPLTGRALVPVPCATDAGRPVLDVEAIEAALAAGARTVLLANPHNPLGRAFGRSELRALRDAVLRHGARVISDEIHAPLVLPGARHLPYAALEGTAGHVTTMTAASKAWNLPGLKCAQLIPGSAEDLAVLRALPSVANHGASSLGIVATVAAYSGGEAWLDGLLAALDARRAQFAARHADVLAHLPYRAPEATYLAWLDARAARLPAGAADPATAALRDGRVMVSRGADFGPGFESFIRVNLGTSAERLDRIVDALAKALPPG
jgi:cystathionine beta-lyase